MLNRRGALLLLAAPFALSAETKIARADFGKTMDGSSVQVYTLTNSRNTQARITNYGGRLVSLKTADRAGSLGDVILGFDSVDGYIANPGPFFGAIIGRYGNRIGHARFTLNGAEYTLDQNDGENTLHGGAHGFDKSLWTARELPGGALELKLSSKDGDQGFPGDLSVIVTYRLTDANELQIAYAATTNRPTVVNLTNHSYFNLKGAGDILGHRLMLDADRFTPVDAGLIPTGELRSVAGTPFDFRKPTPIGARIDQADQQLKLGKGYDHNFVLNRKATGLHLAAHVEEPVSGRILEVLTTEPGIQFYSGNFLDGAAKGKGGVAYALRSGFCLETQHFPDSPNKPAFPSTTLHPGEQYRSTTVYRFSTK